MVQAEDMYFQKANGPSVDKKQDQAANAVKRLAAKVSSFGPMENNWTNLLDAFRNLRALYAVPNPESTFARLQGWSDHQHSACQTHPEDIEHRPDQYSASQQPREV